MKPKILDLKKYIHSLPKPIRSFLLRSFMLFVAWKVVYIFLIIPSETLDPWLVRNIATGTSHVLNLAYDTDEFNAVHTRREKTYGKDKIWATFSYVHLGKQRRVLGIYQACNGLELMVLYAGFILCFSGLWPRKFAFLLVGTALIYAINVLRCSLLGFIVLEHPRHFDFAHKYLFNIVIYTFTFLLWMAYVQGVSINKKPNRGYVQ